MKQKLKKLVMITLNSNRKDIAQYEIFPTKAIYSVHMKIDLSERIKWQPPHDGVVTTSLLFAFLSSHKLSFASYCSPS